MTNRSEFHLSPLDRMVMEIPPEERRRIVMEFDIMERTGKVADDATLRDRAGQIYRALQGRETGFDASYMMFVAYSVHKLNTIEALERETDLEAEDRATMSVALTRKVAELPTTEEDVTDREAVMDDAIREARAILNMPISRDHGFPVAGMEP